ncbi:hypothetical protein [Acetivibrio clariflavus]|uniref:Uncharacterized protein n=1 Tax=Acetivibrio clariflavus (strain DSM 19732 / NBRC 101661 / EBR45) TaxID=720554 RepID=G8LSN1_ACECE|nr:hypothetical protein [Acetivibrio clariflavus]AEV69383.1 hypothetical protein Clocl_2834 [Acetivibrio clariflavus DSM 19732]HOP99772.1 hypothetical protein [Acetivibrio clariflavus]
MKKGIVVILALLLTMGAGVMTPILMNADKNSSTRNTARSTTPDIKTQTTAAGGIKTVSPDDVVPLVSTTPRYKSDIVLGTPSPDIIQKNEDKNTKDDYKISSPNPVVSNPDNKKPDAEPTANKESEDWIERKIREHRNEIDDEDLGDFRRIYSRLNIAYIQSIMNEGLDDEGMTKLKSYLRNTLGTADYERAKELFYKYSYLLSEI